MTIKGKPVIVTKESSTGRNLKFENTKTGEKMSRNQFVKQIKSGKYEDYHVRNVNKIETPVSNPDNKKGNNLD